MKIEVRLFAYFREGRDKKLFLEFNEPVTAGDVIKQINIDTKLISGIKSICYIITFSMLLMSFVNIK